MALNPSDSQMADAAGNPLIGAAQATIADPAAVSGLANNADVATLVALKTELEATNTTVAAILDALIAHGLIKAS